MDKMSKFRRKPKPKPPAIETAVDPRRSTDTTDSVRSENNSSTNGSSSPTARAAAKTTKKSPFRSLRLRTSGKRARGSPPAELPPSSPPGPALVGQDGHISQGSRKSGEYHKSGRPGVDPDAPKIPGFLSLSEQDIESKYEALTWAERLRLVQGMRSEDGEEPRWGHYKQIDKERGQMDRYNNIKPWNHNRVKLRVPEEQFDYVNASTIELPSVSDPSQPPLRYIAMQGPTEPSFSYVWRMIAEQISNPAVVIQLTSMLENGVIKCDQYFPMDEDNREWTLNEGNAWDDQWSAKLTFESAEELAEGAIERRKLLLHIQGESEPRVVWHLLYRRWPDFGLPEVEDLDSFFELMKLSRDLSDGANPRVIHCSAGVGRTGTFITLEHLMRELELGGLRNVDDANVDLVQDTVDLLRQQRRAMVQGDMQYRFIYQVMRRLWQDKYGGYDSDSGAEPAAKRLEINGGVDPFIEDDGTNGEGMADGGDGGGSDDDDKWRR